MVEYDILCKIKYKCLPPPERDKLCLKTDKYGMNCVMSSTLPFSWVFIASQKVNCFGILSICKKIKGDRKKNSFVLKNAQGMCLRFLQILEFLS